MSGRLKRAAGSRRLEIPIAATHPDDLTLAANRRTEGRLSIGIQLEVSISICSIEDRNDLVDDIEGEISEALEFLAWDGGRLKPARGWEAYDVAHSFPPSQ
jgi:hypothetical protein